MKKYINGKIVDMTEADVARIRAHATKRDEIKPSVAKYENRIKELEATVAALLTKVETPTETVEEEVAEN